MTATDRTLNEEDIIRGFHSILKDSLAQARGEGLLDDQVIETGDVDIQIAGPALALYFAALGAKGSPPSISSPDGSFVLDESNCPPSFASFFDLWQASVRPIQSLPSSARYDLALILCDREPLSSPINLSSVRLAGQLKAVAIEITQRRTFQQRYQSDLQHALDSHVKPRRSGESERPPTSAFVPPPEYTEGEEGLSTASTSGMNKGSSHLPATLAPREEAPSPLQSSLDAERVENLSIIRETLYSALADCLVSTPSILATLARGPEWASRGFFASTCLAILEVALTRVDGNGVRPVNVGSGPKVIGAAETPAYLRPFLGKLIEVSGAAKAMADEDDERAMREAAEGTVTSEPRMDRLRDRLEKGAGLGDNREAASSSVDQSVAHLANSVNELAIGMASLPAFAERQREVFSILASVTSF